ncbi:hypothetical protein WJX84_004870 [Apatococcus fuscideae]|uniref:Uncharacterized protein n=1 Tax=Apatococcus fuscideae TaxID=2026836 RepID=A0AAW1SPY5_9CHLO
MAFYSIKIVSVFDWLVIDWNPDILSSCGLYTRKLANQPAASGHTARALQPKRHCSLSIRARKSVVTMASAKGGLLQDKRILVTGSSRGIGQCIAELYAKEGAKLILTAEPEMQQDLDKVAESCRQAGSPEVEVLPFDLTHLSGIKGWAENLLSKHKEGVDVLVNNAGTLGPLTFDKGPHMGQGPLDGNPEEWDRLLAINVSAPQRLVRYLCGPMEQRQTGYIINIGSTNGLKPSAATPAYSCSKWAMRGWSLGITEAFKEKGVKVVTIHPPATSTPMTWDRPGELL